MASADRRRLKAMSQVRNSRNDLYVKLVAGLKLRSTLLVWSKMMIRTSRWSVVGGGTLNLDDRAIGYGGQQVSDFGICTQQHLGDRTKD